MPRDLKIFVVDTGPLIMLAAGQSHDDNTRSHTAVGPAPNNGILSYPTAR